MKKALSLLLALLLLAALSACGQKDPAGSTDDPGQEGGGEALAAYQTALQDFAYQHRLPDGTEFEIPTGFGSVENNRFAVCDMNGDGREELLIHFTTAPTAGIAPTPAAASPRSCGSLPAPPTMTMAPSSPRGPTIRPAAPPIFGPTPF